VENGAVVRNPARKIAENPSIELSGEFKKVHFQELYAAFSILLDLHISITGAVLGNCNFI
jgi:hypothetical protein